MSIFTAIQNFFLGSALGQLNNNFAITETELGNRLKRDGTTSMAGNLDINGYRIINGAAPVSDNDLARLSDIRSLIATLNGGSVSLPFQKREFTATAGQTSFSFLSAPLAGYTSVYVNGVKIPSTDYSLSGSTIILTDPLLGGENVSIEGFIAGVITDTSAITYGSRGLSARLGDTVSVKDFGAKGDGVANDTVAINAAIATGKSIFFPPGHYGYTPSAVTLAYGQILYGNNPYSTTINKLSNGDMFTGASTAGLTNIGLQGNGGYPVTGRGIILPANTSSFMLINCNILDMESYCVEMTADGAGTQLQVIGGQYGRTNLDTPAIKLPTDSQASPRQFIGVNFLSWSLDTNGADNTLLSGCYMRNILFGAGSHKVVLSGNRVSTLGADLTVHGLNHAITGNTVAGRLVLSSDCTSSTAAANVLATGNGVDSGTLNKTDFTLNASKTWSPVSLSSGGGDSTTLTVTGVTLAGGWNVQPSFSQDLAGMTLTAYVSAADTVTVKLYNTSGGPVSLASGTISVKALK